MTIFYFFRGQLLSVSSRSVKFRKNSELGCLFAPFECLDGAAKSAELKQTAMELAIMAEKKRLPGENERKHIHTPWFSIYFSKGAGSFSFQNEYQKSYPVSLILINRGESIQVDTTTLGATQMYANRCQVFFEQGLHPRFSYTGSKNWDFFEIKMSTAFLNELPASASPAWQAFKKKITKNKAALLSESNLYYRSSVKDIAYTLLSQQFKDASLQSAHLHLKMKEILLHVLSESQEPAMLDNGVTAKQYQLVLKAQQLLDKHKTSRSFTIQSLAVAVGTNETTLKNAFKKVAGTTIYKYYMQKQMKQAQKLLIEGYPVSKVSGMIGYSHMSHFSYQFKRTFGISPDNVKAKS